MKSKRRIDYTSDLEYLKAFSPNRHCGSKSHFSTAAFCHSIAVAWTTNRSASPAFGRWYSWWHFCSALFYGVFGCPESSNKPAPAGPTLFLCRFQIQRRLLSARPPCPLPRPTPTAFPRHPPPFHIDCQSFPLRLTNIIFFVPCTAFYHPPLLPCSNHN